MTLANALILAAGRGRRRAGDGAVTTEQQARNLGGSSIRLDEPGEG